jgi:16S rRNA (guanine527-N7)-methyltransferase
MNELKALIGTSWPELGESTAEKVLEFYRLLLAENEIQNLTRLTSPQDFVDGHLEDVRHLLTSGAVTYPAMDLGSGGGVPGLLAAVISPSNWVLCDSEASKARFLEESVRALGLQGVLVFAGRAESYLRGHSVATVVARAVGPVDRIYAWLENCSTWNKLVLLKGPGWDEEWAKFQQTRHRKALEIASIYEYSVGALNKQRKIVTLKRTGRAAIR